MPTNDPTTSMPPMIGPRLSIPEWLSYIAAYQFGSTIFLYFVCALCEGTNEIQLQ